MNEQVLEKLKKILRLATNEGATQGEAEAAMERAKEIAMQNNIDLSMVDHTDPNAKAKSIEVERGDIAIGTTRQHQYHRFITQVIKEVFGVFVVNCGTRYAFIGDKHDVAVSREIFIWLEEVYPNLFRTQVKARVLSPCAADRNGFYSGLTRGLLEANRRIVKETIAKQNVDSNKYAMVLRSKEDAIALAVPQHFPRLKNARRTTLQSSDHARGIGHTVGRGINLKIRHLKI